MAKPLNIVDEIAEVRGFIRRNKAKIRTRYLRRLCDAAELQTEDLKAVGMPALALIRVMTMGQAEAEEVYGPDVDLSFLKEQVADNLLHALRRPRVRIILKTTTPPPPGKNRLIGVGGNG